VAEAGLAGEEKTKRMASIPWIDDSSAIFSLFFPFECCNSSAIRRVVVEDSQQPALSLFTGFSQILGPPIPKPNFLIGYTVFPSDRSTPLSLISTNPISASLPSSRKTATKS
jgi:hypothetical protein